MKLETYLLKKKKLTKTLLKFLKQEKKNEIKFYKQVNFFNYFSFCKKKKHLNRKYDVRLLYKKNKYLIH